MFLRRQCTGTQCKWLCWRHTCSSWLPPCCNRNPLLSLDSFLHTSYAPYQIKEGKFKPTSQMQATSVFHICAVMTEQGSKYPINIHLTISYVYNQNLYMSTIVWHIPLLHSNFRSMIGLQAQPDAVFALWTKCSIEHSIPNRGKKKKLLQIPRN